MHNLHTQRHHSCKKKLCFLSFNDDLGTPPTWRPYSWKKMSHLFRVVHGALHVSAKLCLAAFVRRCQIPDCSITEMKYAHLLLSAGACLASLPLLSRFGVGADMMCSLCCLPPWGEERDMQLLWLFRSTSYSGNTLRLAIGHFGNSDHKCSGLPLVATSWLL